MKFSQLFLPVLKEDPAEAQVVSHKLLVRAGMIRQVTSGVYNWLPFGLQVLRKVENIVREEMNRAGAQEVLMPMVQPAELWQETGRWQKYGAELLRFTDRHEHESCLGPTHEEIVTDLFRRNVYSYKQLPLNVYQIQTKFRDEIRPRFGLMRGREFMMKDAYSFDENKKSALESYATMRDAYHRIFKRLELDYRMVLADSGSIGGDHSNEFHVLAATGEDDLLFDPNGDYAVNVEKHDAENCPVAEDQLEKAKGIEVGHIFYLGTVYTDPMEVKIQGQEGNLQPVHMGCYGIGVSRIVAAAIEQNHDEHGIIWPMALAPYHVGIIDLRPDDEACKQAAEKTIAALSEKGLTYAHDDRAEKPGAKFATMDLIGLPWQCTLGPRELADGLVEWKNRRTGERTKLAVGELPAELSNAMAVAA